MLLLIVGLHLVLGSIWLINNDMIGFAIPCFVGGMVATHLGWKKLSSKKEDSGDTTD